jgi:hypothetical protein
MLVALLLTGCATSPAVPTPIQSASGTPSGGPGSTPTSAASETASPAPTAPPQVGLAWTQVTDPDLASYPNMGEMFGVIAGGPGAIAWGAHWGPPAADGGRPHLGPKIWTTADGLDWQPASVEGPSDADAANPGEVLDITVGGPGFVAIGTYLRAEDGYAILVWTSSDGRTWQRVPDQPAFAHSRLSQVMRWKGQLLAMGCTLASGVDCGPDAVWFSADATTWEKASLSLPAGLVSVGMVALGTDRLWGVGADDSGIPAPYQNAPPMRLTSVDGRTWSAIALPVLGIERLHPLPDGLYLTVAEIPSASDDYEPPAAWVSRSGGLYRSTDLAQWEPLDFGGQVGDEIVAVDGTLIMVGAAGSRCWLPWRCAAAAWRSPDAGQTWTSSPVAGSAAAGPSGALMRSVARLPDQTLVAVGMLVGTDGTPATGAWVSAAQPATP